MKFLEMILKLIDGKKTLGGIIIAAIPIFMGLFGFGDADIETVKQALELLKTPEVAGVVSGVGVILVGLFDKLRKQAEKNK